MWWPNLGCQPVLVSLSLVPARFTLILNSFFQRRAVPACDGTRFRPPQREITTDKTRKESPALFQMSVATDRKGWCVKCVQETTTTQQKEEELLKKRDTQTGWSNRLGSVLKLTENVEWPSTYSMAVLRPTVLYWSGWGYFCQQHVTTLCGTRDSTEMIGLRLDSSRVAQTGTLHTEQTFRGPSPMSLFCYSKGGKRKWHSFCRVGSSPSLAAMQLWAVTKRLKQFPFRLFLVKVHLIEFFFFLFFKTEDLSPAFFPTASDMWTTHPALAYSAAAAAAAAAAAELQGQGPGAAAALQHAHAHHAAALAVHPALHPQLPVRFFHQLHALQHSQQQQQQQQQLPWLGVVGSVNVLSPPTTPTPFRPHHHTTTPSHHLSPTSPTVLVPSFHPVFNLCSYWQQQQHRMQQQQQPEQPMQQQQQQFGDHQQVCKPVQSTITTTTTTRSKLFRQTKKKSPKSYTARACTFLFVTARDLVSFIFLLFFFFLHTPFMPLSL